ncbi:hypothetical protein [Streptomyces sp. NPDC101455]|uniref:hypothetical protein n=1 Tax=Streptomyces sp. NPDC101455 TaxID=3366142 RepID=UPI003825F175
MLAMPPEARVTEADESQQPRGQDHPRRQPRGGQQDQQPGDRVRQQGLAGVQLLVGEAEQTEGHQSAGQQQPGLLRAPCGALQEDREAQPEQEGEEPLMDEQVQERGGRVGVVGRRR